MKEFIDKIQGVVEGTDINRANLMAIQGFIPKNIVFNVDGSITETNSEGEVLTTEFNSNGTITETFEGDKVITKNVVFNNDGSISEVLI